MSNPSLLGRYRRLFALTGPLYILIAFLGRLPMAMSQLGTLLLVSEVTGSYGAGGATAGALAVANGIGAPIAGSLTDRFGQRPVLAVQSLGSAAGMLAILALTSNYSGGSWWHLMLPAAVAGVFCPQVGPLARVRWRPIAMHHNQADRATIDAAFSYEGAADEASFVLGPALVGGIVALADPSAALLTAAVLLAIFGTWFAFHPTASFLTANGRSVASLTARLVTPALVLLAAVQFSIGMVFGSVQTGTTVLATNAGEPGLAGLLHALLGVGSVLAGLAVAALPERFRYEARLRIFTALMLVLALPLLAVNGLGSLAVVLVVLGIAIAPSMITTFTITERVTAVRRIGAAMTVLAATTVLGYAAGSTLAGQLADWGGHQPAYAVTVAATVLASVISLLGRPRLARAQRDAPAAGPEATLPLDPDMRNAPEPFGT